MESPAEDIATIEIRHLQFPYNPSSLEESQSWSRIKYDLGALGFI
jgi:hypothetical protein